MLTKRELETVYNTVAFTVRLQSFRTDGIRTHILFVSSVGAGQFGTEPYVLCRPCRKSLASNLVPGIQAGAPGLTTESYN